MRTKTLHLRGFTPFSLKRSVFVDDSEDGTLDFKDSASMFDSTDDEEIPTAKVGLGSPIKHSSFNRTKNPIKQISNAEEITLGHKAPSKSSSKSATSNTSSPIAFETAVPEIEHDLPLKDIHNHQKGNYSKHRIWPSI